MNVLKELLTCLKPCGFAYIGLGWDSGRLARTIDRRSTVRQRNKTFFITNSRSTIILCI